MRHMKILGATLIFTMIIALSGSMIWAQPTSVRGSKHDLGGGGGAQSTTALTTEVCVFCHTPHGSNTGVNAPLWNKTLPGTTYQRYSSLGTASLDGEEATVGSVSLACLSCHDGTQAMDVVLNAPGSGGYTAGGSVIDAAIGAMTNSGGDPIPMLGSDLRNDHPVSISYAGGACEGSTGACDPAIAATGDPDFEVAEYALINGTSNWWVDTAGGAAGTREKTDMILYTNTSFAGGTGPAVECGSCHDPHEGDLTAVSFMRISNDNSNVCLSCHIK